MGWFRAKGRKGKYREEKNPTKLRLISQKSHLTTEMTRLKYYPKFVSQLISEPEMSDVTKIHLVPIS